MTRPWVRRWTRADHPAPWAFYVPRERGMVRGHKATWRHAYDRVLQIIADQT